MKIPGSPILNQAIAPQLLTDIMQIVRNKNIILQFWFFLAQNLLFRLECKVFLPLQFQPAGKPCTPLEKPKLDHNTHEQNLLEIQTKISLFEKQYNMTSEIFSEKFDSGELADFADFVEWFAYVDMRAELLKKTDIICK